MAQDASRLGAAQNVAISTSSAASTAFGTQTYMIRVACQLTAGTDVHIRVGNSPTAVTTDSLLPVNTIDYFVVSPGQEIAVIGGASAAGTLSVTEMSS